MIIPKQSVIYYYPQIFVRILKRNFMATYINSKVEKVTFFTFWIITSNNIRSFTVIQRQSIRFHPFIYNLKFMINQKQHGKYFYLCVLKWYTKFQELFNIHNPNRLSQHHKNILVVNLTYACPTLFSLPL